MHARTMMLLGLALFACAPRGPAAGGAETALPPPGPEVTASSAPEPPAVALPRVVLVHREGGDGQWVRETAATIGRVLAVCERRGAGSLQIRVRTAPFSMHVEVGPIFGGEPALRECALDALAGLDLDELADRSGSLDSSGFTALFRVEW